jgi:hypothetical protein
MSILRSYDIAPRPAELGGGWRLRLLENGEDVGGGVYPLGDDGERAAYCDALHDGEAWASPASGRTGL